MYGGAGTPWEYRQIVGTESENVIMSGLRVVDVASGCGLPRQGVAVIAGRPLEGSTALALSMACNMAFGFRYGVGYISSGLSEKRLARRVSRILDGALSKSERDVLHAMKCEDVSLYLDSGIGLTIEELYRRCRSMVDNQGVEVLFLDSASEIVARDKGMTSREWGLAINKLAVDLGVLVVDVEHLEPWADDCRVNPPIPMPEEVPTGVELFADVMMLVYRPEFYRIFADEYGDTHGKMYVRLYPRRWDGFEIQLGLSYEGLYLSVKDRVVDKLCSTLLADGIVKHLSRSEIMSKYKESLDGTQIWESAFGEPLPIGDDPEELLF